MTSVPLPKDNSLRYLDILDGKLDFTYTFPAVAGDGVDIYILDTGIMANHTYFGGRAKMIKNLIDGQPDTDTHGHGTHVAGIAAMVARKANILGIKVVAGSGPQPSESLVQGIQFASEQIKKSGRLSVINDAVRNATAAGIPVIVNAGNEGIDACQTSASHEPSAISVGCATPNNTRTIGESKASNYGPCVDIFAQGTDIMSAWNTDINSTKVITGTSQAAPLVKPDFLDRP
ncbi:peptidase S8/S53 domain-containing protein [Paraphysoderma sedebokerense]|nr:peptidase S8/S53 domain-containing protein [Paraphysoderma sedebokerense]